MDFVFFIIAAFLSYWFETEAFLFLAGMYLTARLFYRWYKLLLDAWPRDRGKIARYVLGILPALAFVSIWVILLTMASYDVVGIWVFFYILMGYAWIYAGVFLMERFLDLSPAYDTVYLDNRAAIFPVAGGFLGLTSIYAGANTGNGPGWWVVLIAGGVGLIAWLLLAFAINTVSGVSERITVDRDIGCGIRNGAYLIASGLILARASGGDWTSFYATLIEFSLGWPVIPLAGLVILVELFMIRHSEKTGLTSSVLWGSVYLIYAIYMLMLLPPLSGKGV